MNPHLTTTADCAHAVPLELCRNAAAYRCELIRRLKLRGWTIERGIKLEPGSRGDNTYTCGRLDLLAHPPAPPIPDGDTGELPPPTYPPVLIQIERRDISYRTRAKLQSWGQRPCSGKLVVQLYAREPDPIPEANLVIARGATRARTPQSVIHETADLRRLSHAIGVNEARYQRRRERLKQYRRAKGGRAGMRAQRTTTTPPRKEQQP